MADRGGLTRRSAGADVLNMFVVRSRVWSWTAQIILFGVFFVLLISAPGRSVEFSSLVVGAVRFVATLFVAAVVLASVHESAHVIVGKLLGWQVFGVTIGHGRRLVSTHVGSVRLELRWPLIGGVTIANPTGQRWRDVAMLAAGVTVETAVIAVALTWDPGSLSGRHAKWAIVLVACIDIAFNLWPRRVDIGPVTGTATDGAQLLSVLTTPDQWRDDLEQMRMTPERARLVQSLHGGDIEEALALARTAAAAGPTDDESATLLGTLLLLAGLWREAFDQLAPLADGPDSDALVANNAAWAAVMTFDPNLLPHADRYSEQALAGRPDEPACSNTRGATLVMLGRADDGLLLLQRAAAGRLSPKQKAYVHAFTALAEHRLGRFDDAKKHLASSRTIDRNCPALPEIERLMLAPPAPPGAKAPWPPPQIVNPPDQPDPGM